MQEVILQYITDSMRFLILLAAAIIGCSGSSHSTGFVRDEDVSIDLVPYYLALEKQRNHICGASAVSSRWALTAAHCVYEVRPNKFRLRTGSDTIEAGGELHQVIAVFVHENYDTYTLDYDVAVLEVDKPFTKSRIISLAKFRPGTGTGSTATGHIKEGSLLSRRLRLTHVSIEDQTYCRIINDGVKIRITDRMMCAGYQEGKKKACQGDSGAPLVAENVQVGIFSQRRGCSTTSNGVYTDVAVVRRWIAEKTGLQDKEDFQDLLEMH